MKKVWIGLIGTVSMFFLCSASFQDYDLVKSIERGKEVYANNCVSCHNEDGKATVGLYPPLAKSDYLNANPDRAIGAVLHGLSGEITVNGKKFNNVMTSQNLTEKSC